MKLPFKETDVIWWELMPIKLGNTVKVLKTGRIGWVTGMTIPCSHSGKMNIVVEYYLKTTWEILIGNALGGKESDFVSCRRWEIEKVNEKQ